MALARDINRQILVFDNFLSLDECQSLIDQSEVVGFEEATVDLRTRRVGEATSSLKLMKNVRNNSRLPFESAELAQALFNRAKPIIDLVDQPGLTKAPTMNKNFRFYRYFPGERFKPHADGIYIDPLTQAESRFTFLVFLNDNFEGGSTKFVKEEVEVTPKAGSALCFHHRLLHEGAEVLTGSKYVLRTDVMFYKQ